MLGLNLEAEGDDDFDWAEGDDDLDWSENDDDLDWSNRDLAVRTDVLRDSLHPYYADASDEEIHQALADIQLVMGPAESVDFANVLDKIGAGTSAVLSDPTFGAIANVALPIAGGAIGTAVGGPVGTALGGALGTIAASSLPALAQATAPKAKPVRHRPPQPPTAQQPRANHQGRTQTDLPITASRPPSVELPLPVQLDLPLTPAGASPSAPVADGSAAAAQALLLTQQPDVLQSLLAASLGQFGRTKVNGIPVAQILSLLSQVLSQAATDADELMYLQQDAAGKIGFAASTPDDPETLYLRLIDAANVDLALAITSDTMDAS